MNVVVKLLMGHQEGGIPEEELKLWPSVPFTGPLCLCLGLGAGSVEGMASHVQA